MENYTIHKGFHMSRWWPKFHENTTEIKFTAIFDENCHYILNNVDDFDIDKLYGISWGFHQDNSFRIGWNILGKQVGLYAYYYNDGVRKMEYLDTIDFNTPITFTLKFLTDSEVIIVKWNGKYEIFHFEYPKENYGYYLYPYFGGNERAPHTMNINLVQH